MPLSRALLAALCMTHASTECMYTIVGGNGAAYSGDGGAAAQAQLYWPRGVAVTTAGFYFADTGNNRIRFVNATSGIIASVATSASLSQPRGVAAYADGLLIPDTGNDAIKFVNGSTGIISTIAGRGLNSPGDGQPATNAQLSSPRAVAVNGSEFFIADMNNNRIRRVNSNGIINTIAGTGTRGYSGDGAAATSAQIGAVFALGVYAGGLLLADSSSNRIRCVSSRGIITTVGGGGSGGTGSGLAILMTLQFPQGVASDGLSKFIVADTDHDLVRLVDEVGNITTVAGSSRGYSGDGGLATAAQMTLPTGAAVDGYGGLFITDDSNHAIRYVTPPGMCRPVVNCSVAAPSLICTFAPVAPYLHLNVTLSSSRCMLQQSAPAVTRNVTCPLPNAAAGTLAWTLGNVASSMTIVIPMSTSSSTASATFALTPSSTSSSTASASSMLAASSTSSLTASSSASCTPSITPPAALRIISTVAGTGGVAGYSGDGAAATNAKLFNPTGVASDGSGGFFVAEEVNHVIRRVTSAGIISTAAGTGTAGYSGDGGAATTARLNNPFSVATNDSGSFLIADAGNHVIRRVTSSGIISSVAGTGGVSGYSGDGAAATSAKLFRPRSVAFDASGGFLIADYRNHVIRRVTSTGIISTVAGAGGVSGYSGDGAAATTARLNEPSMVAYDESGNVLIADTKNHVIRRVTMNGIISTVAGTGAVSGYRGDGGAATSALLNFAESVAFDGSGGFLIVDQQNHVIRRVTPSGIISTAAGTGGVAGYSGDGAAATSAKLANPFGVASDGTGGFLIAELGNHVIRRVNGSGVRASLSATLSLSAPSPSPTGTASATSTGSSVPSSSATAAQASTSSPSVSLVVSNRSTLPLSAGQRVEIQLCSARASAGACSVSVCSSNSSDVNAVAVATISQSSDSLTPVKSYAASVWVDVCPAVSPSLADVRCASGSIATLQLHIPYKSVRWPVWTDMLLWGSSGVVRSSWAPSVNVSARLCPFNITACDSLLRSVSDSARGAVYAVARSVAQAAAVGASFAVTLRANSLFTLVMTSTPPCGTPPFTPRARVRLAGVECSILWVSPDGSMLHAQMPPYAQVCNASSRSVSERDPCSAQRPTLEVVSDADVDSVAPAGALLACPPMCNAPPGGTPAVAPKLVSWDQLVSSAPRSNLVAPNSTLIWTNSTRGTFTTAPNLFIEASASGSIGVVLVQGCVNSESFTDVVTGVCTNASDPRSSLCAYGDGAVCVPCPRGALCPGGFELWPLPGFHLASPGVVQPCSPPALERCNGWDAQLGNIRCGPGYEPLSFACQRCNAGFYTVADGACVACPSSSVDIVSVAASILLFAGGLLAAVVLLLLSVCLLARCLKAPTVNLVPRTLQLTAWTIATVQFVAQFARLAPRNAPPPLPALFAAITLLQLEGVAPPAACIQGNPFVMDMVSCCVSIALAAAGLVWTWMSSQTFAKSASGNSNPSFRSKLMTALSSPRLLLTVLTLLFAASINSAVGVFACQQTQMSRKALSVLSPRSAVVSTTLQNDMVNVWLLIKNPTIVCFEGDHTVALAVAIITIVFVGVVYPVVVSVMVRLLMHKALAGEDAWASAAPYSFTHQRWLLPNPPSVASAVFLAVDQSKRRNTATSISSMFAQPVEAALHSATTAKVQAVETLDNNTSIRFLPSLQLFVAGDYRPAAHYFYALDRFSIVLFAVASLFLLSAGRLLQGVIMSALIAACSLPFLLERPYMAGDDWKLVAKTAAMLTAMLVNITNITLDAMDGNSAVNVSLSYLIVCSFAVLVLSLIIGFVLSTVRPPPRLLRTAADERAQPIYLPHQRRRSSRVNELLPHATVTADTNRPADDTAAHAVGNQGPASPGGVAENPLLHQQAQVLLVGRGRARAHAPAGLATRRATPNLDAFAAAGAKDRLVGFGPQAARVKVRGR